MATIAVPNRVYPPPTDILARARVVLTSLLDLTSETIERLVQ